MGVRILLHLSFRQGSNEKSSRLLWLVLLGSPLPKSSPFSFTNSVISWVSVNGSQHLASCKEICWDGFLPASPSVEC